MRCACTRRALKRTRHGSDSSELRTSGAMADWLLLPPSAPLGAAASLVDGAMPRPLLRRVALTAAATTNSSEVSASTPSVAQYTVRNDKAATTQPGLITVTSKFNRLKTVNSSDTQGMPDATCEPPSLPTTDRCWTSSRADTTLDRPLADRVATATAMAANSATATSSTRSSSVFSAASSPHERHAELLA